MWGRRALPRPLVCLGGVAFRGMPASLRDGGERPGLGPIHGCDSGRESHESWVAWAAGGEGGQRRVSRAGAQPVPERVTAGQLQDRPLRDPDLVAARAPSYGNRGKRGRPTGPPARRARPRSARPRPTSTRHPHTLPRRTTGGRAAWEAHVCLKGTKLHFDRGCSNPASRTAKFQILIRETESHRWSRKGERQRRR